MTFAIVGFAGPMRSGKSSAARHLVNERGFMRVRFADPIKAMLAALGLSEEELDGGSKETPCSLLFGKTPRFAMQTLGMEWGRKTIHGDLWLGAWRHRAVSLLRSGVSVVADDVRFPNEAAVIRELGGIVIYIERDGCGIGGHESEKFAFGTDCTLINSGSLSDLYAKVDAIIDDCD